MKRTVSEVHKPADAELKRIARQYRHSAYIVQKKIQELEKKINSLPAKAPRSERHRYDDDLKTLRQMYRTTCEIGKEAEHYYERGWWRSEVYTVNSR